MQAMLSFALGIFFLIVVGLLFALVARIPPIRKRARRSRVFRIGLTISTTLAALLTMYVFILSLSVTVSIISQTIFYGTAFDGSPMVSALTLSDEVQDEIWQRYLYFSDTCSSQDTAVCDEAEALFENMGSAEGRVNTVLASLLIAAISGFSAAHFTWRFTRRTLKQKNDAIAKSKNDFIA